MPSENTVRPHNSVVVDTDISSNYSAVFQNKGQHMSVSCVICLDISSRNENLMTQCVNLFPDYPEGKLREFFVCFIHIFIFAKFKQRLAAGFSTEQDMSCSESLFALEILLFDIDTH